jgi:kumamolisin
VPADITSRTIGLIEFNQASAGGWNQNDIDSTLSSFGLTTSVTPHNIPVTGSDNPGTKFDPNNVDGEVLLDICVAAAVAPGAKINVYWGEDETSVADWVAVLDAILAAPPDVLSSSYVLANGDDSYTPPQLKPITEKFQALGAMGVTVFAACGDDGARSLTTDGKAHVQYPGSDPWLTSCGGTTVSMSTTPATEWVWNDLNPNTSDPQLPQGTGGGVSAYFTGPLPEWQQVVSYHWPRRPGRGRKRQPEQWLSADAVRLLYSARGNQRRGSALRRVDSYHQRYIGSERGIPESHPLRVSRQRMP